MDALDQVIAATAATGLLGLLGVSVLERLVPILPSYALLVAVGIAAGRGYWPLPAAVTVSVLGSVFGCACFYTLGSALGEARARRWFGRVARMLGVSSARFETLVHGLRARRRMLAFVAQLVPTIRLVAPGIAGALAIERRGFLLGTALGVLAWNCLFIGVGYGAAAIGGSEGAAPIALEALLALLAAEAVLALWWRRYRARRPRAVEVCDG